MPVCHHLRRLVHFLLAPTTKVRVLDRVWQDPCKLLPHPRLQVLGAVPRAVVLNLLKFLTHPLSPELVLLPDVAALQPPPHLELFGWVSPLP